jgi:quinol monooxygenase YgiN
MVSFTFRPGRSWDDPEAVAAERITENHWRHIPEILSWRVGRNTTPRAVAADFALIGRFADRAALERYLTHPDHQRGVRAWRELSTWVIADLEDADELIPPGGLRELVTAGEVEPPS